ncbi:hypothetical protein V1514DRAFT_304461 [Lipomyces japonicus]|uniref:uncharacterized protein n=1 Tax=Lipomyces japonicus TaxID=56871 RepID=UPI0034CF26F1
MLYQFIGITRVNTMQEVREIVKTLGKTVINSGGVIRQVDWLGRQFLPRVTGKNQQLHFAGHHFSVIFDSSSRVQQDLLKLFQVDPRFIQVNILNKGRILADIAKPIKPLNMI